MTWSAIFWLASAFAVFVLGHGVWGTAREGLAEVETKWRGKLASADATWRHRAWRLVDRARVLLGAGVCYALCASYLYLVAEHCGWARI